MQALRRLFYRNRSITDGDGRHFIKRENGIERALAGADGLAVMRVHAAAVAWHILASLLFLCFRTALSRVFVLSYSVQ